MSIFVGVNFFTENDKKDVNCFTYSHFMEEVHSGSIAEVTIQGPNIFGLTKRGEKFNTYAPFNPELVKDLLAQNVVVTAKPMEQDFSFWQLIIPWIPFIVMLGLGIYSVRQMQTHGNNVMGLSKSSAKIAEEKKIKIKFDDIAGVDEAKQELMEVVDFLKEPQKFQKLGGKIPRGFLLVGPPGTGKTLLAKAVAGEAGVPFFSIAGSAFVEVFVGVGASRVRDLFAQAKKNSPCIIFIDEIDAVGRQRGHHFGGSDERDQTLNQMLVEMDGFDSTQTVIVVAATNRADVLDHALLRPGRFDRRIVVPLPDAIGREKILAIHMKKVPVHDDVKLGVLARSTPGFSGADLANLVNESALLAARHGRSTVRMTDFEEAKDKVIMGAARRSFVLADEEKRLTAYHEAGHAIVSVYTVGSDPIHKATILPRGDAMGMVVSLPETDRTAFTYEGLIARIMMSMGGKIAEELIFGSNKVTTGASADIKAATILARKMVVEFGMSPRLGFLYCDIINSSYFSTKEISESTAQIIDEEVRAILSSCYEGAKSTIIQHKAQLKKLAEALLEKETLSGEEVKYICDSDETKSSDTDDSVDSINISQTTDMNQI
jgi:cell division protease FtsH